MGLDSSGLASGQPLQGLYVNGGPTAPLFSVDPELKIRFGVGWDQDLVAIVAGVSGDIKGNFDLYFANAKNYLDDLSSFPLQGQGSLSADLALFYDTSFNMTAAVLEQTLKSVFEIFIEANPVSLSADALVAGIKKLDPNFTVPPAVQQILNGSDANQSVDAVIAGLQSAGYQASQTFQDFISNPAQGFQDISNDVNHAGAVASSEYQNASNAVSACCSIPGAA